MPEIVELQGIWNQPHCCSITVVVVSYIVVSMSDLWSEDRRVGDFRVHWRLVSALPQDNFLTNITVTSHCLTLPRFVNRYELQTAGSTYTVILWWTSIPTRENRELKRQWQRWQKMNSFRIFSNVVVIYSNLLNVKCR